MASSHPHLPKKSSSFVSVRGEKQREIDRNLSLGAIKLQECDEKKERGSNDIIQEGEEEEEEEEEANPTEEEEEANAEEADASPTAISADVDNFIALLLSVEDGGEPPIIPESAVERFVQLVEKEIAKCEAGEAKVEEEEGASALVDAVERIFKLTTAVARFSSDPGYQQAMNRAGGVLHQAMCFLEGELYALLHDPSANKVDSDTGESPPPYPAEKVAKLQAVAGIMISAGYSIECCQVFAVARRNAFEAALGFEKVSIEDVTKMAWEALEGEVASWTKAFKHATTLAFPAEHAICEAVFAGHRHVSDRLFRTFMRSAVLQLLSFAEAVSMTKRSSEKLFKVVDIYQALRDASPGIDALLPDPPEADQGEDPDSCSEFISNTKAEIAVAKCRLGEAAVAMFCDLESSIKSDNGKTPLPGGAVHPLTRHVMDYLKNADEYRGTLEQVFIEHKHSDDDDEESGGGDAENHNPFAAQLAEIMNLLDSNLEAKSRLYKDPALCNIFLMNNGRYVAKKVKESPEIHQLLGEAWYRRRSTDLRQYHKNYQRETWSRVLACLRDEGLTTHGKSGVAKPALKERFKSFNAMIDEIHKTQSTWVVNDAQLQSELRVSLSAVVVPAYRSFLGRFAQHFYPGRQTEKYVKFAPEDIENMIDELFEGNTSTAAAASKRWL
ncbi:LOW QUALITY PROTEIN: exocyst complex component EXO70C2-like [Curcuma longa]|uniref:LOW QUALITY PROTEIN: exocyst complex component EXO70C2-like n=1 Tax=Curcuma longa TaxID=136217 RepID=UPI003D9E0DBC